MPLTLITGAPGSGKSTVMYELQSRGYKAYGTDEHGYSEWVHRKTGKVAIPPENFDLHTWYKEHEWVLNFEAIARLRKEADAADEVVFLCGGGHGIETVAHLFNQTVVLTADLATLKQRVTNRKDNDYGKAPEELKIVLEWQENNVEKYRKQGAVIVDTTQPVGEVVDEILAKLGGSRD